MGDDDTTDDDNHSGFSAPSLSAKNITKNSQKPRVGSQLHGRFDKMNGNFRDLQINVTNNSNFDMKEEHHSLYLSDTVTGYKSNNSGGRDEDDDSSVGDFVIEKKNASPARLGKQGKSDKGSSILSIPSALSSPASSNRRSIKKTVTFSADTMLPREDHLALSITKHLYTRELGYTQYHIQVMSYLFFFLILICAVAALSRDGVDSIKEIQRLLRLSHKASHGKCQLPDRITRPSQEEMV